LPRFDIIKITDDERKYIMPAFKDVTIIKKANVYFGGKVTSRTVLFSDGSKKTLGIMFPGDYEFSTAEMEIMEILAGDLDVMLPGATGWITVKEGGNFKVPAQSKFSLKVKSLTDYCCSYIQ
jgi:purine/pyrimidine-nucleoside phosphorylase